MSSMVGDQIRVLIADSDPLVSRALARLLGDVRDLRIVATAADGPATLRLAAQLKPDVALIDAGSTLLGGMELTRSLCRQQPELRIVGLSVYATFSDQALAAGACRFLLKDAGRDELVAAIRYAARAEYAPGSEDRVDSSRPQPRLTTGPDSETRTI